MFTPEFNAPVLGRQDSRVEIAVTLADNASGVLYALGGFSGGITLFRDDGHLVYENNMMIIDRYQARSAATTPMVSLAVDGVEAAKASVARTVPAALTASETFGVGVDLGSPVSPDCFDRRPFRFTEEIEYVDVEVFPPSHA